MNALLEKYYKAVDTRDVLRDQVKENKAYCLSLSNREQTLLKAKQVVLNVGRQVQSQLEWHVSQVVSLALESIWDDPYTFHLEFVSRSNRTEADLFLSKNGQKVEVIDATGGGVADVVAMMLKIAYWSLNKNRAIMLFDEPTKFLHSPKLQKRCSELVRMICDKLGLQVIMITDQDSMADSADRVFTVRHDGNKSVITVEDRDGNVGNETVQV